MGKSDMPLIDNWKTYRLSFQKQAEEIVADLSTEEKISLMSGRLTREEIRSQILNKKKKHYNETPYWAGGVARKNVMPILFVDGSRGVVCQRGVYTAFPAEILRGATFDRNLETEIGAAIAEEVIHAGGNLFGGVCVNLPYNPGWGRMQECYGEDSYLLGEMGSALIRGVQSRGVIACVKHYAFNSMENNRLNVNITCDRRTEQEVFLPHFKKCVDAGAGAVMTAYNSYQGEMCGQNRYLIRDVLKGEWGFDGFVMSDFTWGINDTVKAVRAGMDVEMPHTYCYGEALSRAVAQGTVEESLIDEAAVRLVRTLLAHGEYIQKVRPQVKKNETANRKEHIRLALQAAREGITLLENRNGTLPLKCVGKGRKIALLGLLAEEDNLGDRGSSCTYPPYVVHCFEAIWKELTGAELIIYSGENKSHCRRLAREADAVIIVAGNSYRNEGEHIKADETVPKKDTYGGDRIGGLSLPEEQLAMLDAVAEVRRDAVLVLTGGGPIVVESVREKVGAILMQFYPGMEGATALAEILFGRLSPSGRLPFAVPKSDGDEARVDWMADEQTYGRYHGYTLLEHNKVEPTYPFGYGLSYTSFSLFDLRCFIDGGALHVAVTVQNTGSMEADTSVLLFVGAPGVLADREERLLKGFARIHLKERETKTVTMECPLEELKYFDEARGEMVLEPGIYRIFVEDLQDTIPIS